VAGVLSHSARSAVPAGAVAGTETCAASNPTGVSDPLGGRSLAELNVARPWAEQVLREVGLPVTRPRLLVLIALRERERPMTAQDLHWELGTWLRRDRARAAPGMTTVYRVLAALAERGVLHCFHHGGAVTAYRLCPPIRHHHLVCRCCGRVQEQPPAR